MRFMLLQIIAGSGALLMIGAGAGIAAARRPASVVAWFAAFLCAATIACAGVGGDDAAVLLGAALGVCVFAAASLYGRDGEEPASAPARWRLAISLVMVALVSASITLLLQITPPASDAAQGQDRDVAAMTLQRIVNPTGLSDLSAAARAAVRSLDLVVLSGLFVVLASIALRAPGPAAPTEDRP